MTLLLRPRGRGNWSTLTLTLTGARAQPILIQRGQTFALGGVVWRIVKVTV